MVEFMSAIILKQVPVLPLSLIEGRIGARQCGRAPTPKIRTFMSCGR